MSDVDKRELWVASKFFDPPESRSMRDCKLFGWMMDNFEESKVSNHDWIRLFLDDQGFDTSKHRVNQDTLDALKGVFVYAWKRHKVESNEHRWDDLVLPIDPPTDSEQIAPGANCYRIHIKKLGLPSFQSYVWFKLQPQTIDLFVGEPAPWPLHPTAYKFSFRDSPDGAGLELCWGTDYSNSGGRALSGVYDYENVGVEVLAYIQEHKLNYPELWEQDAIGHTQTPT